MIVLRDLAKCLKSIGGDRGKEGVECRKVGESLVVSQKSSTFAPQKTKITLVHKPSIVLTAGTQARQNHQTKTMKQGIHPDNYRPVVFKDMSNGDMFLSRSTAKTNDTVEFEGETYPLVKLEISSSSHPFYTGKSKLVDTAGRVDKFMSRYARSRK